MPTLRIAFLALALAATDARADEFRCPKGTKEAGEGQEKQARWCERQVDGKLVPEGPFWRFYPDGAVASKETFVKGQPDGKFEAWHQNGKLARKGTYRSGKAVGTWKAWDVGGILRSEIRYGSPRATRTEYFPSGTRQARGDLVDGAKAGTWTLWDASGKVRGTCDFGSGVAAVPPGEVCQAIAETIEPRGFARPVATATVAADGTFVVQVGKEAWGFTPPGGWVADAKVGAVDQLPVVLYPRGAAAWKGPATMYVRPVYRDGKGFQEAVAAEGEIFQKGVVDYGEKGAGEGKTAIGRPWIAKALTYRAARPAGGGAQILSEVLAHENVAFLDASDDVVLLVVLASPDERQVGLALPALRELASSARAAPVPSPAPPAKPRPPTPAK